MLTIFSIPKAFKGHIDIIQHNAIESWTKLKSRPEVILLGNDEGTADVAREFGLRHLWNVATSDHGTPLLSDLDVLRQRGHHALKRFCGGVRRGAAANFEIPYGLQAHQYRHSRGVGF
jgi:hypothetical protein